MLKIACQFKPNGEYYRHLGFANALKSCGHQFVFWDDKQKPLIDLFDEFQPDIFIGTTFDLNRGMIEAIKLHPEIKIVLKGGNWGPSDESIDKDKFPILFISDKEKVLLEKLKKETGKPDFVFCHYHPNQVNDTMRSWKSIGIEPLGIPNAADIIAYPKGNVEPELLSDIAFVGGYWGYKAVNLDEYIVPLCGPTSKLKVKVFGNQKWSVAQYCGLIQDNTVKDLYRSAKICPNVSEPHSNKFGFDVVERPFKILSSGGFLLMDRVKSFEDDMFDKGEIVYYDNQDDYFEKISYFLKHPEQRHNNEAIERVYQEHTYHHRMAYLLNKLEFTTEAKELITCLTNLSQYQQSCPQKIVQHS
jgi:hypothetical protein